MYKPPKKSVRFREASVKRVSTVYAISSGLVIFGFLDSLAKANRHESFLRTNPVF